MIQLPSSIFKKNCNKNNKSSSIDGDKWRFFKIYLPLTGLFTRPHCPPRARELFVSTPLEGKMPVNLTRN
jgi:hypothetical protein